MAEKANGRRKRGCLWWGLRVVGGLLSLLIVLLAFSVINQRISLARDLKNLPAPGELVGVDGHLMHLYCIGEGSPTVVIDAGNSE